MPAWAMISAASGFALDEPREPGGDRRQPAAAVDQDRHAPLLGEREHGREPLVGRVEPLRARMELDPARAGVEAALRLLDRRLVQVEPHERDQPAAGALGERERAVVRGAERRVAVGLVEAEHERARDPVLRHHLLEDVVVADHAVDVVARGGGARRRCRRPPASAAAAPRRRRRSAPARAPAGRPPPKAIREVPAGSGR